MLEREKIPAVAEEKTKNAGFFPPVAGKDRRYKKIKYFARIR
jgi:hypothetical protein